MISENSAKFKANEATPEEHVRGDAKVCEGSGNWYHLRNQSNHSVRLSPDLAFRITEKIICAPQTVSMTHQGTRPLTTH